jgi:uncharacterized protein (TIGR03546 family)
VLSLVKLVQSIVKALHSDGTPGQVGMGLALGAVIGLTPLVTLHNAVLFGLILILNVSLPGALLGMAVFTPLAFLLDPAFDALGRRLLVETPALIPLWTSLSNTPVVPLTDFNNTVVLGSFTVAVAGFVPLFYAARWGVTRYRATVGERIRRSAIYRAVTASKLYNVYRLFRPEA